MILITEEVLGIMCYKNTDQTGRGRPVDGFEKRTVTRNVRIEPFLDKRLEYVCKTLGINKSEAIRQGLINYLNEMEKAIHGHYI